MADDPKELFPKLEAEGEDAIREKLAQGVYGERRIPLVKEWLEQKSRTRSAAYNQRHEDRESTKIDLAAEANSIARVAGDTSKKAYRMSALSVIVSVIALIVVLVSQCSGRA